MARRRLLGTPEAPLKSPLEIDPQAIQEPSSGVQPQCVVCAQPLSLRQIVIAESRGQTPRYCSPRCRETATRRVARARKRAKAQP